MIPRAFRILLPSPPLTVEQQDPGLSVPASGPGSEHEQLTAGTADLWRELVHLCWETPT